VRHAALVNMERLSVACGETVNLGILEKTSVIYLEKIQNDDPVRIELQVGRAVPAHCTGLGKAILAFQPPDRLEYFLSSICFENRTKNTIMSSEVLRAELQRIREQGYALDRGELIEGINCVAVPVFSHMKNAVAAISIAGPSYRLNDARMEELIPLVKRAAEDTSRYIGWAKTVTM
jgi:DNA-binding IclR family transcriptional regulator